MPNEELFQAGIEAVKEGDLEKAAVHFASLVKADPNSEQGWLWLGICCTAVDRREYCFRRVLAINPDNLEARQQLERLPKFAPASPSLPHQAPVNQSHETPKPASHVPPSASPFILGPNETEVVKATPPTSTPVRVLRPAPENQEAFYPPPVPEAVNKPAAPEKPLPQRRKPNKALAAFLVLIPLVGICGLALAYFYFSGQLANLKPPSSMPTEMPAPNGAGSNGPTATWTPVSSMATASPTVIPPTVLPGPLPTKSYTPIYEKAHCKFEIPEGAKVDCGFVVVPEDRSGDPSHTIRLAVAVYHSTSPHPASDPVIFFQGGPGGEAVMLSSQAYQVLVTPFLADRDFIAYDQRGTGLSEPALNCDELTDVYKQDIYGQIANSSRVMVYANALLSCRGNMKFQGINLGAYTTLASAADVKDVLTALGYGQADLYGASYGTRLAQVFMRDYPEMVRSVVIDSVVPIETNMYLTEPETIDYSLKILFNSCTNDPQCQAAYPQLEAVFWNLVKQLTIAPVSVTAPTLHGEDTTEIVDGNTLLGIILMLLKNTSLIYTAPQSIYQINSGDYSTLIAAQYSSPYGLEGINLGLYISMMCHEQVLTTSPQELQKIISAETNMGDMGRLPFLGDAQKIFDTCKSWGATTPVLKENDPVVSNIPTLVIAGKYDPTTPPFYSQQVAAHLGRSFYLEFPDQGHCPTASNSCAMRAVLSFLKDPSRKPDDSCLSKMEDVQFLVPYTGTPPVKLETIQDTGFVYKAPLDWFHLFPGIYWRNESPLDITQISVVPINMGVDQIEKFFSTKLYGFGGLDDAPFQVGQRQVNGLNWTLYTATSFGRPIDMAMVNHGSQSIVVYLFCHKDEHDALYQTVFLPMIDSVQFTR